MSDHPRCTLAQMSFLEELALHCDSLTTTLTTVGGSDYIHYVKASLERHRKRYRNTLGFNPEDRGRYREMLTTVLQEQ